MLVLEGFVSWMWGLEESNWYGKVWKLGNGTKKTWIQQGFVSWFKSRPNVLFAFAQLVGKT